MNDTQLSIAVLYHYFLPSLRHSKTTFYLVFYASYNTKIVHNYSFSRIFIVNAYTIEILY